jgi:hypothetical protein
LDSVERVSHAFRGTFQHWSRFYQTKGNAFNYWNQLPFHSKFSHFSLPVFWNLWISLKF